MTFSMKPSKETTHSLIACTKCGSLIVDSTKPLQPCSDCENTGLCGECDGEGEINGDTCAECCGVRKCQTCFGESITLPNNDLHAEVCGLSVIAQARQALMHIKSIRSRFVLIDVDYMLNEEGTEVLTPYVPEVAFDNATYNALYVEVQKAEAALNHLLTRLETNQ